MNQGKKATPGQAVSPAEINDLIIRVRDMRTHLKTNARHLATIESRLNVLEAVAEDMKAALAMADQKEEVPFLAWGRGEGCPVCGERPPEEVEKDKTVWNQWTVDHIKAHAEEEG